MKGIYYEQFGENPVVTELPDPIPVDGAAIIEVKSSGLCLSDWHGWMGHDADIRLPHVPGHEFAGVVVETSSSVRKVKKGMRVTVPFVGGCGKCTTCLSGNPQICPDQFQPGFTHWGSFAQYVSIHFADFNLVELPSSYSFEMAASLGCRFTTAFRAIVDRAHLKSGEWLTIVGCGGVGLSALQIGKALGAKILVIDPKLKAVEKALSNGAHAASTATDPEEVKAFVYQHTKSGSDVSLDAFGSSQACINALAGLKRGGRHVQVGLITSGDLPLPVSRFIAEEITFLGAHGIQARRIYDVFNFIEKHDIQLVEMIEERCDLTDAAKLLTQLDQRSRAGLTLINDFA